MHMPILCVEGLEFPMKGKDIPKLERPNKLNISVFELTGTMLTPIHINTNYDQPQIYFFHIFLYENHICLITKLQGLINNNSHVQYVCTRCLNANDVLQDHIERCIHPKPTKISFSWKEQLEFEDNHMKVSLRIRVYADLECFNRPQKNSKVLFKQFQIAVGYYLIAPFGNQYHSYFGEECAKWFVNEMMTLEKKCK